MSQYRNKAPHRLCSNQLKRMNFALKAHTRVNQALIHCSEECQLLQNVVDILIQVSDYGLAWIGVPEDDIKRSVRVVACAGVSKAYLEDLELSWGDGALGQGPIGRSLRGEGICLVHDLSTDPDCVPWRDAMARYRLRSLACFPLLAEDRIAATLAVYTRKQSIAAEEVELLAELAEDLAYGIRSIRARKQAEEERTAREQLETQLRRSQKLEAVGRLASAIAHEFNNLLTVIAGQTELLSLDMDGKHLERIQKVSAAARRAAELTRQLSSFSQQKARAPQLTTLNALIQGLSLNLDPATRGKVELKYQLCPDAWPLRIDGPQVEQVVKLLVATAVAAMPAGGCITIESANCDVSHHENAGRESMPQGRYVSLGVSYPGVTPRVRLVEPFFATKPLARGMGLRLAMIYELVKENQGVICAKSTTETGTCFRVHFPANEMQSETPASSGAGQVQAGEIAGYILVEDVPEVRKALESHITAPRAH